MNIQQTLAVVIDSGTGLTKSGLASEDAPRSQFQTIIGKPKLPSIMVGMEHKDSYIGDEAQQKQNILYLKHPIKHGVVQDNQWQNMTQILHHIYYSQNRVTPQQHPCLMAETPKNSIKNRHKMSEIMFQTMNVPHFYLANQSVLALFAVGKTTGLVVDSGAGVTSSVPIYQGYAIPHAMKLNNFAGNDIDTFLIQQIKRINPNIRLTPYNHYQTILDIKSRIVCNLQNSQVMKSHGQNTVTLPDGQQIDISPINNSCGQLLFNPKKYGYENILSLPTLVKQTIQQCDKDIRGEIFNSIVPCGGTSNMMNFGNILEKEISSLYPSESIMIHEKQHREFLPWIGGSILSSLQSFQNMWVSKQQYLENGASIIDKKCF